MVRDVNDYFSLVVRKTFPHGGRMSNKIDEAD